MTNFEDNWWVKAIREHEREHGPSGPSWNISMILQRLYNADIMEDKTTTTGFNCPKCNGLRVKMHSDVVYTSIPVQYGWTCLDCNHYYVRPISIKKP